MLYKKIFTFIEVILIDSFAAFILFIDLDKTLIMGEIIFASLASIYTLLKIINYFLKLRDKWKSKKS